MEDRAVYHNNDFDSTIATYIIGICIKNWVGEHVVYVDLEPMVNIVRVYLHAARVRHADLP